MTSRCWKLNNVVCLCRRLKTVFVTVGSTGHTGRYCSLPHSRVYYGCFFMFAYILPLSLICVLYSLMIHRLLSGVNSRGSSTTRETTRTKRRITRLVVVVVATFAVCWLPLQLIFVVQFVAGYTDHGTQFVTAKIVSNCLAYTNSCVNPFLYAFLSDAFRKSFYKVMCCLLPKQNGERIERVVNMPQGAVHLQ